jgi:hypothetical protein
LKFAPDGAAHQTAMAGHINARIFVHQHGRCLNQTRLQVKGNDGADFFANQTGVRKVARRENPEIRMPKVVPQSWIRFSEFGFLSDFEFWISNLTLRFLFSIPAP